MWLGGSEVPSQPTPEPSKPGLPGTLGCEPCIISCRCGSEQDLQARPLGHSISSQLTSNQEPGLLPKRGRGCSPSKPLAWSLPTVPSLSLSVIGLLTALFLLEAPFLRSQRNGTLAVAAVAVNLCTKEVWQPGCEVKACLGELKFSGGRETACRRLNGMKGLKCIRKSTKKSYLYLSPFPLCTSDVRESC